MKDFIKSFAKEHPFLTFFTVSTIAAGVKETVVGTTRAITGKYPTANITFPNSIVPKPEEPVQEEDTPKEEASEETSEE